MKVLVSLLTLIGLLMLLGVMTNEVYAPPPPNHYTAFEYAEHVLIGKILSVETLSEQKSQSSSDPNDVVGFMLYEIQVDEFMKNPLETNVIKVVGRYSTEENPRSNVDPPYEVNQKVLLYVQKDEPDRLPNYDLVIRSDESKVIDESISKPYFLSKSDGEVKHYFPLKQLQSGVKFHNVECKKGMELVYKKTDDTSACATLLTKIELVVRGWAEDTRVLLGCTGDRVQKCYPEDPFEYRKALYYYYFGDEKELPSSDDYEFESLHTTNACTDKPLICFGEFDNGTKIRIACDYPIHGCGVMSFDKDNYKTDEENEN